MPHSSGGGSHSGGSHSGGSHSSHSSHHSGGGSSGSSSSRRSSAQPFRGSRRYLYYSNKRPCFVYANYDVHKPDMSPLVSGLIIFFMILLPCAIGGLMLVAASVTYPKRLEKSKDRTPDIVIEDNIGVFEDKKKLKESLKDFYAETGIIPAVITVSNEEWKTEYSSLERYAYAQYVSRFKDEYHWLIVYSETINDDGFNDWYWEGMQGDDTDIILTEKRADEFTQSLQKRLLLREKYSVDDAIAVTFDEYRPKMMKPYMDGLEFGFGMFLFLLFSGVSVYNFAVLSKPGKVPEMYKEAKLCKLTKVYQEPCSYCGGVYIIGMHTTCPHCGAALPEHHYIKDEQGNVVELML